LQLGTGSTRAANYRGHAGEEIEEASKIASHGDESIV
jgi:hypothetical protein